MDEDVGGFMMIKWLKNGVLMLEWVQELGKMLDFVLCNLLFFELFNVLFVVVIDVLLVVVYKVSKDFFFYCIVMDNGEVLVL